MCQNKQTLERRQHRAFFSHSCMTQMEEDIVQHVASSDKNHFEHKCKWNFWITWNDKSEGYWLSVIQLRPHKVREFCLSYSLLYPQHPIHLYFPTEVQTHFHMHTHMQTLYTSLDRLGYVAVMNDTQCLIHIQVQCSSAEELCSLSLLRDPGGWGLHLNMWR